MANNSINASIVVGVIAGLLVIIFGNPINDIMAPPEVIPVAKYSEKVCPPRIYFQSNDKTADFSLKFQNIGDDGSVFVNIFSNEILSKAKGEDQFKQNSTKTWFTNSRQYQDFNFELKQNEEINNLENITISFNYGCSEIVFGKIFYCKQYNRSCNYQKETNYLFNRIN